MDTEARAAAEKTRQAGLDRAYKVYLADARRTGTEEERAQARGDWYQARRKVFLEYQSALLLLQSLSS